MSNLSASAFKALFDSHVLDICDNLRKLDDDGTSFIGVSANQEHHEVIVDKYNGFIKCLRDPKQVDERPNKFRELVSYITLHFIFENKYMAMLNYPDYEKHKTQHKNFIDNINGYNYKIRSGESTVDDMVLYIGHWLIGHVLITDKQFSDFEATHPDAAAHRT
ncbi:MAG: hemerythrin family protein [Rhodospirillaceae bacterium]